MADYTNIENPYDNFVDRSIESQQPINPDQPVRDGGSVKDLWITSFIRSINWRPVNVGFSIDGETGIGEFQKLRAKEIKIMANDSTGENGGIFQYFDAATLTFNVRPDGRVLLTPTVGQSDTVGITMPTNGSDMHSGGGVINITGLFGNYAKKAIKINIDGNLTSNYSSGIEFIVNNSSGGGTAYAMSFPTSPSNAIIVNAAVGGSQDYKIRVRIGSTTYYIPCYTT